MKTIQSLSRRATALVLAVLLAVPAAYASAGARRLQTSIEIVDGLTYRNTITENSTRRIESFSLELEPDSVSYPILLQSSGTIYGAASVNRAVTRAQELGYHVLGAVNTDFFSISNGMPLGIVIEDGVYKSSSGAENAMLITDNAVSITGNPQVELSLFNEANEYTVIPQYFNKVRDDIGGVYLLNSDFSSVSTRTSSAGWHIRLRAEPEPFAEQVPALTVNSTLTLEVVEAVRTDQPTAIAPDEYILTSADASGRDDVFESFQVGDRVTLTTRCDDPALSAAQWAGGVGDIMVWDGVLTDSSAWTYAKDGRQPRTALGIKEDGSVVLYAVDGRQSGYSSGLSQLDLAQELLDQGCRWAVNLDGGGSTSISVWLPGQSGPALRNKPSDGRARSCATFLLLVTDQRGDGQAERLAWTEDGPVVLTGSTLPLPQTAALDAGLNPVEVRLDRLTARSRDGLGTIENNIYTAGSRPGTDMILLSDPNEGLEGSAQVHVVDTLTSFTVSKEGSSAPLTALQTEPGEQVQLTASGQYWSRTALRDFGPVTWTVEGDVGSVDESGLFTASKHWGNGSITFSAGGLSQTVQITMENVHQDVPEDHWAYEAVEYCYQHGIVTGVTPVLFGRDNHIRRGDFMLMLYSALGRPAAEGAASFTDVSPSDYYYTALSWAQSAKLASGTGDGAFSPQNSITREQAFTILRQALPLLDKQVPDGSLSTLDQFQDRNLIADYAKGHTATLVEQGLVSGKGDGVDPQGLLTRAEMAAILYRLITFTPADPQPDQPQQPVTPQEPGTDTPAIPDISEIPDIQDQPELPTDPSQYTLSLDRERLELASGASDTLTAALDPQPERADIIWTSSSPQLAHVSSTGMVTNLNPSREAADVTITASWNGLTASCTVSCDPARRSGVVAGAELGLNVRSGPGTSYSVTASLADGDHVLVLGEEAGWYQILHLNAQGQAAIGYVSGDYLNADG